MSIRSMAGRLEGEKSRVISAGDRKTRHRGREFSTIWVRRYASASTNLGLTRRLEKAPRCPKSLHDARDPRWNTRS